MRIAGKVIVVTGAANGVGEAAARRFAAEGATLVLTDLDEANLERVAGQLGAACLVGDISQEATVQAVAELARRRHGRIDIWFSNAGWFGEPGPGSLQAFETWQKSWDLHVMAHAYAAEAVLPEMLARGSGYLIQTASEAAFAVVSTSARYTVSKHAALSLNEWLAVTYRPRGICVSCFCPGAMDTNILRSSGLPADHPIIKGALSMAAVAEILVRGIAAERFLIDDRGPADRVESLIHKGEDYEAWLHRFAPPPAEPG